MARIGEAKLAEPDPVDLVVEHVGGSRWRYGLSEDGVVQWLGELDTDDAPPHPGRDQLRRCAYMLAASAETKGRRTMNRMGFSGLVF